MIVVNGRKLEGAVRAVDLADHLRDLCIQLGMITVGGRSDLNQHNLISPHGIVF